jgi:hypothetical protein
MTLKIARKYPITPELVLKCATGSTAVFEQRIMHALLECGLTDKIYGELYNELFSPESSENVLVKVSYPEPAEIIEAIHEAGGIAVLAHPASSDCIELMQELTDAGILDGIEVYHPNNTPVQEEMLKKYAKAKGLLAIGGTDFKGMYSKNTVCIGDCMTPDADLKALMSYKAKMKKKKAATEK